MRYLILSATGHNPRLRKTTLEVIKAYDLGQIRDGDLVYEIDVKNWAFTSGGMTITSFVRKYRRYC